MLKNVSSNNNKKYVPPRHSTTSTVTEKKTLKKEFSFQPDAFPALAGKTSTSKLTALSFVQAAQTRPVTKTVSNTDVFLPGWVYIQRNNNGKIEYKYSGSTHPPRYPSQYNEDDEDARLDRRLVKYRLAKEQYERDNDVLRLGDYSEYYNIKTVQEQFDEEEITMLKQKYQPSDSSDTE